MRGKPVLSANQTAAAWCHDQSTAWLLNMLAETVKAMEPSICRSSTHALGSLVFTVATNDAKAAEFLTHCLLPAEPETGAVPHLQIFVCSGSASPFKCPPSWDLPYTDLRQLENLHLDPNGKLSAYYDHARACWMILDMDTRRALLWIEDAERLPVWEGAAPFRQFLQWSLVDTALSIVHGGAVTLANHGVLLVGPSGSGKSTTVAACVQEGLGVCGDDLVVVDRASKGWFVHALHDSIKLLPNTVLSVPSVLKEVPWRECGEKRFTRYSDVSGSALARSTPLRALMSCKVTGNDTSRLIPISPSEMLKAIGPPTVFFLRGRETHILKEVGRLVRSLPCMRLELGRNPAEVAAFLRQWLETFPSGGRDA